MKDSFRSRLRSLRMCACYSTLGQKNKTVTFLANLRDNSMEMSMKKDTKSNLGVRMGPDEAS